MSNLPKLSTFIETQCQYHAAARLWVIPQIEYTQLPDGTSGISAAEINKLNRAIANHICGEAEALTSQELDFLCDVADSTITEVAAVLRMDKSAISRWRSGDRGIPHSASWILKRWFWYRLFGRESKGDKVALHRLETDISFLSFARERAVKSQLTYAVRPHIHTAGNQAIG